MRGNFRWWIVGLLFAATALNYLDRNTLAVLEPMIKGELHWTPQQFGWITGAFWLAYAAFAFLVGRFIDRVGTRVGFAAILSFWGAACALHSIVAGVLGFVVFRFLLGIGEAGVVPATAKACAEWFPKKERGLAYGVAIAGLMIGGIVAPPITGKLATVYGWRIAFLLCGGICALWVAAWLWLYDRPATHRRISDAERAYILEGQAAERREHAEAVEASAPRVGLVELFRLPQVWGIAAARLLGDPVFAFFAAWIPKYMYETRGIDFKTIAFTFWLPFAASAFGSVGSGWISSFLIGRGMDVIRARKIMLLFGAALMPVGTLTFFVSSLEAALACLCVAAFGHVVWVVATQTLPGDMFPSRYVGYITGTAQTTGSIGNTLAMLAIGAVVASVSYKPVFIVAGILHPIGTVIIFLTLRNVNQMKAWLASQENRQQVRLAEVSTLPATAGRVVD
jgi:ACS family hexuronate transporter-like MFS transporter